MCVLAFAWRMHRRWPLVMAGNRDELHARPAQPLHRWPEAPHVLAGRDLLSGGSWLGVSEQGRFAVITNLRGFGLPDPGKLSRGGLVRDFLVGEPQDARDDAAFNPFSLIEADVSGAAFTANRPALERRLLQPGLYGLSNGGLDEPWPKTTKLKAALADWLLRDEPDLEPLFSALRDETRPADGELPATGISLDRERLSSAIFIRNPIYGTRCSTVVRIDEDGYGEIAERSFGPDGEAAGEAVFDFAWPPSSE